MNKGRVTWTLFVRGSDPYSADESLREHIDQVVFEIHPDFAPSTIVMDSPPFQVRRDGWGTFDATIYVHFTDKLLPPVKILHKLDFGGECAFSSLSPDGQQVLHGPAILVQDEAAGVHEPGSVVGEDGHDYFCTRCAIAGSLVMCDGCSASYHLGCLTPPLQSEDELPEGCWLCPACEGVLPPSPDTTGMGEKGRMRYVSAWLDGGQKLPDWCGVGEQRTSDWLERLGLSGYADRLAHNGYGEVRAMVEDTGWCKLVSLKGHVQQIMFALQCIKCNPTALTMDKQAETPSQHDGAKTARAKRMKARRSPENQAVESILQVPPLHWPNAHREDFHHQILPPSDRTPGCQSEPPSCPVKVPELTMQCLACRGQHRPHSCGRGKLVRSRALKEEVAIPHEDDVVVLMDDAQKSNGAV
eukprot:TRINITY_DN6208_c0_g1_i2.p1 TRINITY_DN6208_c0_g1~~TRINITY_DN6208_c0_g1_i2.p1  ORF type:complete len:414 (+),score=61.69 TRINITY_DN6208_c0_g1_i2:240-1481(+)